MALPTASDNQFPKVILEEVANDGSATPTPAADHRAMFLGEDGDLHLKDSAGAVSDVGTAAGAVAMATEVERVYVQSLTAGTSHAVTIAAVAAGKRIVVVVQSYARDVNTPTCTNVTFTEVASANFGTSSYISVYVGVVAGGSSGTTITVTATGSDWIITDTYIIGDALTPTAGASATLTNTDAAATALVPIGPLAATLGDFFVVAAGQSNGTTSMTNLVCSSPIVQAPNGGANIALVSGIGRAQADQLAAWYRGGSSGGDMAAVIGIVA